MYCQSQRQRQRQRQRVRRSPSRSRSQRVRDSRSDSRPPSRRAILKSNSDRRARVNNRILAARLAATHSEPFTFTFTSLCALCSARRSSADRLSVSASPLFSSPYLSISYSVRAFRCSLAYMKCEMRSSEREARRRALIATSCTCQSVGTEIRARHSGPVTLGVRVPESIRTCSALRGSSRCLSLSLSLRTLPLQAYTERSRCSLLTCSRCSLFTVHCSCQPRVSSAESTRRSKEIE